MSTPSTFAPAHKAPPRVRRFMGIAVAFTAMVIITAATYLQTRETCKVVLDVAELGPDEIVTFRLENTLGNSRRDEVEDITFDRPGRYEFHTKPGQYTVQVRRRPRCVGYCPGLGILEEFRLYPTQSKVLNVDELYGGGGTP